MTITLSNLRKLTIERDEHKRSPVYKKQSPKAKKAIEIFPNNQQLIELYRQIVVGIDGVNRAVTFSQKGLEYFNNQDDLSAAEQC